MKLNEQGEVVDTQPEVIIIDEPQILPNKQQVSIKKVKIVDDIFLYVEYSDDSATVKKDCKDPIHDDLKFQIRRLDDHLAKICEQFNQVKEIDTFNVNCKGFTIGGHGDHEGVCLIGYRGLDSGKYLNLVSPFVKWDDNSYALASELAEVIEACKYEVMEYLFNGKHQPDNQLELDFDSESYSEDDL